MEFTVRPQSGRTVLQIRTCSLMIAPRFEPENQPCPLTDPAKVLPERVRGLNPRRHPLPC